MDRLSDIRTLLSPSISPHAVLIWSEVFLLDCWITICVNNYRFTVSYVIYQLVKVHPSCGIELLGTYCYRFWIENDTNFMFGKIIFTNGVLHETEALAFWTHVYVVLNTPLYLNYHVVSCQYHIRLFYPYLLRYFPLSRQECVFLAHQTKGHMSFCHHLASIVRRNFSYLNLLLWNHHWTRLNQIWRRWSLGVPLSKLCPRSPRCIKDGSCC